MSRGKLMFRYKELKHLLLQGLIVWKLWEQEGLPLFPNKMESLRHQTTRLPRHWSLMSM